MSLLSKLLGVQSEQSQESLILDSCPYTKDSERQVSFKIDLEKFCAEKEIALSSLDSTVFKDELTINSTIFHSDGELTIIVSFLVCGDKTVAFCKTSDRLDLPSNEKTREESYADMLREDMLAEKDARHFLHLILLEKRCVLALLYGVNSLTIYNDYNVRFSSFVDMKISKDIHLKRKTLGDVVKAVFDELRYVVETNKLVTEKKAEQKSKNLEIAKRYVLEERKRQMEKKQDAEKKTRAALDNEASQRAQEAADLKAMLGQKGANAPKPEDI